MKNIRYKQRLTKEKRVSLHREGENRTYYYSNFSGRRNQPGKKKPAPPHTKGQEKLGK